MKNKQESEDEEKLPPLLTIDRPNQSSDRLAKDKVYLISLTERVRRRSDVNYDIVYRNLKKTTFETLEYLKKREQFWEQLELRKETASSRCIESYRWLM